MPWTDLFKSKSAKLEPDGRVRWFGKLPTYADYYRSPTEEDWTVEFNEWVLRGFEIYQSRLVQSGGRRQRVPVLQGVIRLPKSRMTVFASLQDYGGDMHGRPFPLCFFAGMPTPQWPGPTGDHAAAGLRVIRDLTRLHREVPRLLKGPGRFESIFGGQTVDLDPVVAGAADGSWQAAAQALSLTDWFAGAQAVLRVKDLETWFGLAVRWGDRIVDLESDTFEPTLRLPLAGGIAAEVQAAGWLHWLESRMDLDRRALCLAICGETEREAGHLCVIARDSVPEDFVLATALAGTVAYADDLSQVHGAEESMDKRRGASGTWRSFVEEHPASS
jgi:hypothetical protein